MTSFFALILWRTDNPVCPRWQGRTDKIVCPPRSRSSLSPVIPSVTRDLGGRVRGNGVPGHRYLVTGTGSHTGTRHPVPGTRYPQRHPTLRPRRQELARRLQERLAPLVAAVEDAALGARDALEKAQVFL